MDRKFSVFLALLGTALASFAINWDNAWIRGTTPGGKVFFEPNEEMAFSLTLEGVKEALPANTYFVDWERRGDDGLSSRRRARSRVSSAWRRTSSRRTGSASRRTTAGRSACSSRAARGCVRTRFRWRRSRRTTTPSGRGV